MKFTKNFFVTGAFVETNRKVELEICKHIPKQENATIVEFGMGHGNITQEILNTISPTSELYAFEVNREFCEHVQQTIKDERLNIINDGAENLTTHVSGKIDAVISSIPFSFFSKQKGKQIIQTAHDALKNEAYFSQVLLTKFNFKKFQQIFSECQLLKIPTFPVYYIYHCQKKSS
ncbi:MAG: methyltransferase [Saprospiraceae bacterium]|nr:methyltransferase [Saprospiraceae bacterium]